MKKMQSHGHKPTMKPTSGHSFPADFGFKGSSGKVPVRAHYREGGAVKKPSSMVQATDTVENVQSGLAGKNFRPGFNKGGDVKQDKAMIKSAVHKHEKARHPGSPLTKLAKGGVPAYNRKPMIDC